MFAAFYGIVVGLLIIGWWPLSLAKGRVPEVETEPIRLAFHLAADAGWPKRHPEWRST